MAYISLGWYDIPELVAPIRISLIEGSCSQGSYWTNGSYWLSWSHHFESLTGATMTFYVPSFWASCILDSSFYVPSFWASCILDSSLSTNGLVLDTTMWYLLLVCGSFLHHYNWVLYHLAFQSFEYERT